MMMQVSKVWTAVSLLLLSSAGTAQASRSPASSIEIPSDVPGKNGAVYDLGTLKNFAIETLDICTHPYKPDATTTSGHSIKMLGTAYVYMGPSNGQSVLGHAAERFVYCRDQQIYDFVYEYAEPDPLMMSLDADFEKEYGISLANYSDAEKLNITKSLYVTLSNHPASYYHMEQMRISRTIYETWFDLDSATMYKMLAASASAYLEQKRKIIAHESLPEYKIFGANCATPVEKNLEIANPAFLAKHLVGPITPGVLYRNGQAKKVKKTIIYPSQRLLRMLRLKAEGKSRLFEGFVPLSKTLKHTFPGSWVLLYDEGSSPWRKFLVTPAYGAVNLVAGAAETVFGFITTPLGLIEKAKFKRAMKKAEAANDEDAIAKLNASGPMKFGIGRMKMGLGDMMKSLAEVFTLKIRYPVPTKWTDEEFTFFHDLQQNSALLEFMKAEWEKAPLIVQGEASDEVKDPSPEAPTTPPTEENLAPDLSKIDAE
jgi:hypothetical protein